MKEAFKSKKVYIITAILSVLGVIPFFVALIMYYCSPYSFESYVYVLMAICASYLLLGYAWGDLHNVGYRRKNKNWDGDIPKDVRISSWKRRLPFFMSALLLLLIVGALEICFIVLQHYPFV